MPLNTLALSTLPPHILTQGTAIRSLMRNLGGSIAAHLIAAKAGARIIRTHDVSETVQALRVATAIWDKQ